GLLLVGLAPNAWAVTDAQDIATTIRLRGYECGGDAVTNISESTDASGTRTILATCPNGQRYRIVVTPEGRVSVQPAR
ncbi:MAG TPA: hypothetical protein VNH42_07175, partial [Mariprofundaceae bacterium]|nr:hypothetical protein [Mariprofundaceae bacterium]